MTELATIIDRRFFLESPRWHDDRIWVSDFYGHVVLSSDLHGNSRVEVELGPDRQPSGLGWLPDGRLLIVSMLDRRILRREHSGEIVEHADLSGLTASDINDMIVDERGYAFVSAVGFDSGALAPVASAPLLRVAPDGSVSIAAEDLYMPNGMAILGGETLVVAETLGNRLTAFDLSTDGALSGRREWAVFGELPTSSDLLEVMPQLVCGSDGIAADSSGAIWVADSLHNRLIRVEEGGAVLEDISTKDLGAFACALGGADGTSLFICCAPDFNAAARKAQPESVLLVTNVDVAA